MHNVNDTHEGDNSVEFYTQSIRALGAVITCIAFAVILAAFWYTQEPGCTTTSDISNARDAIVCLD